MSGHFEPDAAGIRMTFTEEESKFLSEVLVLLSDVGRHDDDPAADRLTVPVYLDDPEANAEWWRWMGSELDSARAADRSAYHELLAAGVGGTVASEEESLGFLRVLNEGRLALGARLGIAIESDYENLDDEDYHAMGFLGVVLEELTDALATRL